MDHGGRYTSPTVVCCIYVGNLVGLAVPAGTSKVEQQKSVATALLALQYWLDQLTKCPALQPYNSCITLLCTAANCTGTQAGAQLCGLPVDNIHCCEDQKQLNTILSQQQGHVLLVDASVLYGDNFSISRFVQLALTRNKDIACFTTQPQPDGAPLPSGCQWVNLADEGACPRLLAADASSLSHTVPLCLLTPATQARAQAQAQARAEAQASCSVAAVIRQLIASGELFGLSASRHCTAEAWADEKRGTARDAAKQHQLHPMGADLPERFTDAGLWDYGTIKREHAAYSTSSNLYGCKPPSQHELHLSWNAIKGGLADVGGSARGNTSLKTAVRKSIIHHSMDGW